MILQTHRKFYHKSIHNAAKHGDEVKSVPGILKVALKAVNVKKERESQRSMQTLCTERADNRVKQKL